MSVEGGGFRLRVICHAGRKCWGKGGFWDGAGGWKGGKRVLPRKMGDGSSVYGELIGRD